MVLLGWRTFRDVFDYVLDGRNTQEDFTSAFKPIWHSTLHTMSQKNSIMKKGFASLRVNTKENTQGLVWWLTWLISNFFLMIRPRLETSNFCKSSKKKVEVSKIFSLLNLVPQHFTYPRIHGLIGNATKRGRRGAVGLLKEGKMWLC